MGIAELAAVALIEDEDDPLIPQVGHPPFVAGTGDGGIQLLNGGDDQVGVVGELLDQHGGVLRPVHAPLAKFVELPGGLVVQVLAVDHEDDLVHLRQAL